MAYDPQVVAYLDGLRALGVRPAAETPLEELRRAYDEGAAGLFGRAGELASVDDADADGIPVRIYRPAEGALPGLVYFHGGGWVIGSFASHDPLCRTLAERSGCAIVAVDYRLAPEHPYPAAIEDAWTATMWASRRFGRLVVGGDSAGGQLAASVAIRARDAGLRLVLQALIYPITDHGFDTASYRQNTEPPALTGADMQWFWSRYLPDPTRGDEPDCSPLRAGDLGGVAPALVVTAEFDPLRDEAEAYAQRLDQAGVRVALRRYAGMIHGFVRLAAQIDEATVAIAEIAAAVHSAFAEG